MEVQQSLPDDVILGETKVQICECKFKWIIYDFIVQLDDFLKRVKSPIFSPKNDDGVKFMAELQLSVDREGLIYQTDEENLRASRVELRVYLVSDKRQQVDKVKYRYRIPATDGKKSRTGDNFDEGLFLENNGWSTANARSTLLSEENGFLADGNLTIFFEVMGFGEPVNFMNNIEMVQPKIFVPECLMREKIGDLLETEEFSDVTLVVGEREIRAHKAILGVVSTVFAAMFKSDVMEKKNNRVDIKDVKADVLMELLRFVYTGETKELNEMAIDLLSAADKYDFERLKCICELVICRNITIEKAAEIFITAELHRAVQLKRLAMEFIVINLVEVKKTAGYKTFIKEYPELMDELLTHCVTNMKVNQ